MPGTGKYGVYTYDMVGQTSVTNGPLFDIIYHHKDRLLTHADLVAVAAAVLTPSFASPNATSQTGLPNTLAIPGPMCDTQMFPEGVDMDYRGGYSGVPEIPNYNNVKAVLVDHKGAEGWPTTVYTPPLASPGVIGTGGPGSPNGDDPLKIPVTDITEQDIKPNYAGGGSTDGTRTPASTAENISSTKLDPVKEYLVKGRRPSK